MTSKTIQKVNHSYLPPNMLPPVLCDGALVVDMLAAANRFDSAPPNSEPPLCAVVAGAAPNTDACVAGADPNTDGWPEGDPKIDD